MACSWLENPSLNFPAGDFVHAMDRFGMILIFSGNDFATSKLMVGFFWDRSDADDNDEWNK
jgi:hypothetical protein